MFGKVRPSDPRTLKDIAGFERGVEGLLAIRQEKSVVSRLLNTRSSNKASEALKEFKESFTPEQRVAIDAKKADQIGREVPVLTPETSKNVPSATFLQQGEGVKVLSIEAGAGSSVDTPVSPGISPGIPISPSPSPSPSIAPSPSVSPSPSPSLSPSPSP